MSEVEKEVEGRRRGWRDDPLSVFLLVGAVVLALMYGLETRQRAGLDARELQAQAVAERAGFVAPECVVGAAGGRGEVLVVSCKDALVERLKAGIGANLDGDLKGFGRVYLAGRSSGGGREAWVCELVGGAKKEFGACRELEERLEGVAQVVAGKFEGFGVGGVI